MCLSTLILWLTASIGLTSIVVDSKLLKSPRDALLKRWPNSIGYLASCYQCAGMYCGGVCGAMALADSLTANVVLMAFAGSAVAQVFAAGMNHLERART